MGQHPLLDPTAGSACLSLAAGLIASASRTLRKSPGGASGPACRRGARRPAIVVGPFPQEYCRCGIFPALDRLPAPVPLKATTPPRGSSSENAWLACVQVRRSRRCLADSKGMVRNDRKPQEPASAKHALKSPNHQALQPGRTRSVGRGGRRRAKLRNVQGETSSDNHRPKAKPPARSHVAVAWAKSLTGVGVPRDL